jgi:methylphosphotriester-DNA--protein-cysteine methyltransferase
MVINGTSSAADTSAQVILGLVAEARHQFPESPIVLLNGAQDASRRALLRLSCLGVAALMFEGIDDRAGVADAVLANARAIHLSQRLRAALRGEAPPWLIDIWANAVARGYERTRVPDLARASGLGIRGFTKRLGKLSGLVPSRMIRIAEMLCAIDAIEAGPWNVIEVVRLLGYKQRRTLERITGEVIGCTPWETRHQGGVTHALACVRMLVKVNRVALQE